MQHGNLDVTLEETVRTGDVALVIEALTVEQAVNRRGQAGLTPLMVAAGFGKAQIVALLLDAGADVLMLEPKMGASALHKAAQGGNCDVIMLLLEHGAFIDQQSPTLGNTALMDAVLHKQLDAVRMLLAHGAKTTLRNHWNQTALDLARDDGLKSIVSVIEEKEQQDIEYLKQLSLITAAKLGDQQAVEQLIDSGALPDRRTPLCGSPDDDYTALGIAAREGHAGIVRLLLQAGSDSRQTVGLMRGTPLHEAAFFGHAEVIKELSRVREGAKMRGPELDVQGDYNGLTALHDAVWHGHLEAARALVEAGARLDLTTHAGLTPRALAELYGYEEIVRFLVEAEGGR